MFKSQIFCYELINLKTEQIMLITYYNIKNTWKQAESTFVLRQVLISSFWELIQFYVRNVQRCIGEYIFFDTPEHIDKIY